MTAIQDFGLSHSFPSLSPNKTPKLESSAEAAGTEQGATSESAQATEPGNVDSSLLSSSVQGTLIAHQTVDGSVSVPSADEIAAADILALDTVHALDSNHNGTLSEQEIATLSPLVAVESASLDTNNDGQVSAGEISHAMLSE